MLVCANKMDKFVIHCVFDGRKGQANFNEMCAFCLKEGISCVIRPFGHTYEEDKDEIIRLPAYHVYYRGDYELTFYPGDCPKATLGSIKDKENDNNTGNKKGWGWFRLLGSMIKIHIS